MILMVTYIVTGSVDHFDFKDHRLVFFVTLGLLALKYQEIDTEVHKHLELLLNQDFSILKYEHICLHLSPPKNALRRLPRCY